MRDEVKVLAFDLAEGREIFDAEDNRVISTKEANDVLRTACYEMLGLNEKSTARDIKRALERDSAKDFFALIEEILDVKISSGWNDDEFFDMFVDSKNIAEGDENEFTAEGETILYVEKLAGSHHDLVIQRLADGKPYSVPTSWYGVKVGDNLRQFLLGKKDWNKFLEAVAKAFVNHVKGAVYAAVMGASVQVPQAAQFNKSGTLAAGTKATFDTLIEDVSAANSGADVMIMGTKTALKKITALADVNWASLDQKDAMANTGRLGVYEGTVLYEIPQRFDANTTTRMVDDGCLLIMPIVDNKFVKLVDNGEVELTVDEIGGTRDDMQTYEVQRKIGVGTLISRIFGKWTF